ncbi:hypothetical protein SPI_02415 [Niveomyces insectorum RCEF 264]|uniref:GPI anchored protein n=1 Tax=Niveomyces insectorum RCEF 264 TaxID=1081102 RepID=A0A162KBH2_9HYPO|nr:hypothetical protein SPI_02415 [Niveomyces insectorum RCEF 264]
MKMFLCTPTASFLSVALALFETVRAVTVLPGGVPKPYAGAPGAPTPLDFFQQSAANEFAHRPAVEIFMSNVDNLDYFAQDFQILPSAAGFVRGALQAWGEHLHFVVGPDEVWLTVLGQVNAYVNAQAEAAAAAQNGTDDAAAAAVTGSIFDLAANHTTTVVMYPDWYTIIEAFDGAVGARAGLPWLLHDWIAPNFTTSTDDHVLAALVLMLAQTRVYRADPLPTEGDALLCGLPSVTLLGTREDWAGVLWRVQQLPLFGAEAAAGSRRPTAAAPSAPPLPREPEGNCSGSSNGPSFTISGWLTAFYYWDNAGGPYGRDVPSPTADGDLVVTLDNVTYPRVDLRTLPVSYARTSFVLPRWNDTDDYEVLTMGGTLGKRVDPGPPTGYVEALNRTRHAGVALWNMTDEMRGTDGANQTWDQWAHAAFGVDAARHGTLTPLTAWVLYGPAALGGSRTGGMGSNTTASNGSSSRNTQWQPEMELGTLAAALLSHYNASECTRPAPAPPLSQLGRHTLARRRHGWR